MIMINIILTIIAIICLIGWSYFTIRQQMKFNEIYAAMLAIRDMTDEKCLEYAQYVVKALKENKTVLTYTAWQLKL